MIPAYFHKTSQDEAFYQAHIASRLPARILDAHQHIYRKEFCAEADPARLQQDWAAQCAGEMSMDDSAEIARTLFPGVSYEINALTTVAKGSDFEAANAYLRTLLREGRARYAMMTLDPAISDYDAEKQLVEGGFAGFKPYPDMVSGRKGADIRMFDFIPHSKLEILARNRRAMILHIPRAGRLADPRNVDEIKEIRDRYPELRLIIAHFGRSYSVGVLEEGLALLGEYAREIYFDMAAVLNPEVLRIGLRAMDLKKVLWGTDLPVFLWHGRRRWTRYEYFNLAYEDFPWNRHEEGAEAERQYTFFLYEQVNNILDVIDELGGGRALAEDLFYNNARRALELIKE